MTIKHYDVILVGAGVSGSFAALKIAKEYPDVKVALFDMGRPPAKRRSQMWGFLGLFPNSDGKLYTNDLKNVEDMVGKRKAISAKKWMDDYLDKIIPNMKIIKDTNINKNLEKKIKKAKFDIQKNDHVQLFPKDVHAIAKHMGSIFYHCKNITNYFDTEIISIKKEKKLFILTTTEEDEVYSCKKLLLNIGRSGWRQASKLYEELGIIKNNDNAKFGIRIEMPVDMLPDFNESHCTLVRDDLEIGPFCWEGSIIPEDHIDMAVSAFRSNESRWKTDKVSFNLMGNRKFPSGGYQQVDRVGQLSFIIANERIIKEKISTIMNKKSKTTIIEEYDWLTKALKEVSAFVPDLLTKAYYHLPTIYPMIPKINVKTNMETDVKNLYVAGESAGIYGITSAILTGLIAADSICKGK
jgi:uncharacterized FAD-dependent dehydrogenase